MQNQCVRVYMCIHVCLCMCVHLRGFAKIILCYYLILREYHEVTFAETDRTPQLVSDRLCTCMCACASVCECVRVCMCVICVRV